MKIYAPKRLKPNARVAIVAPGIQIYTNELLQGLDVLREMSLEPVLGNCVRTLRTSGGQAAPLVDRISELRWAFEDPKIDAVIPVVGGNGSAALLPYLDYDVIRIGRKPFLGMSDITALETGIYARAGLCTINGQSLSIRVDKGKTIQDVDADSLRLALELMMSDRPWGIRPFVDNPYIPRVVCEGLACGQVVGGNLETFTHLLGTNYFPDCQGSILFIEDVHKGSDEISRLLLHLKLASILDVVSGVVIGEFQEVPKYAKDMRLIEDVVQEYFSSGPPCVYGYSFSHGPFTSPIPMGANCRFDTETCEVYFDFVMGSWVESYY